MEASVLVLEENPERFRELVTRFRSAKLPEGVFVCDRVDALMQEVNEECQQMAVLKPCLVSSEDILMFARLLKMRSNRLIVVADVSHHDWLLGDNPFDLVFAPTSDSQSLEILIRDFLRSCVR